MALTGSGTLTRWQQRVRLLKRDVLVLALAYRDPRVSWPARLFAACVVAYAFSPIDLIPDPIPLFGYLDDLVIVPLGIILALKMIPGDVIIDCRAQVDRSRHRSRPVYWIAGGVVVAIWLVIAALAARLILAVW